MLSCSAPGQLMEQHQLCKAAWDGNLRGVELSLQNSASCSELGRVEVVGCLCSKSALHAACQQSHLPLARALLCAGAEVNIKDSFGGTPPHGACLEEDGTQTLQELLQRGADICVKRSHQRCMPFDLQCHEELSAGSRRWSAC